ncbi:helix-turn-helix domain-containing protein [Singulisphaera acidiphila]|uniref:Putative transcription regulator containing HTH domain n=1 Tax=Singulisphaera acidiphila (strain ATCC BAA-1392 / DSM 18658 / VKM B-2454 / MOB10) TaxID=886293 RepID=L0DTD5_SINAD|nr:helix-turn-helix domain-containing protein [Singulisphaera acidiphila]AGA31631.1 putative transcription regulator containing HTH domain [Singulisphaera acidiphila DSM 18658]
MKKKLQLAASGAKVTDRYLELVLRFPLRPIRSEDELTNAISVLNSLIDQEELSTDEDDYLEVLGDLISKYETEHHPRPPVTDGEMLRHLIDAKGTTQAAVATETGIAVSTVSEILSGKRGLNRRHIETLSRHFHVSPAVFIGS